MKIKNLLSAILLTTLIITAMGCTKKPTSKVSESDLIGRYHGKMVSALAVDSTDSYAMLIKNFMDEIDVEFEFMPNGKLISRMNIVGQEKEIPMKWKLVSGDSIELKDPTSVMLMNQRFALEKSEQGYNLSTPEYNISLSKIND